MNSKSADDRASEKLKGICILLIVIGHDRYFNLVWGSIFPLLYNFHVWAFFFIAATHNYRPLSSQRAKDLTVRYMVPNTVFVIVLSVIYYCLFLRKSTSLAAYAPTFFSGLFFQSAWAIDRATGFQLYWFLPALCVYLLLLSMMLRLSPSIRLIAYAVLLALHGCLGMLPEETRDLIPFGLGAALYVLPLAIAVQFLASSPVMKTRPGRYGAILLFVAGTVLSLEMGTTVNLGFLYLYGYSHIFLMLMHDLIAVSGFFAVLMLAQATAGRFTWMDWIGRNSLYIFLTHKIFFEALWLGLPSTHDAHKSSLFLLFVGIAAFVFSVALSLIFAMLVQKIPLIKRAVFPRNLEEWKCIFPRKAAI